MTTPDDINSDDHDLIATDLAAALGDVGQMATHGASIANVFSVLSTQCVHLLPIGAAGILLVDSTDALHAIGSSSHAAKFLDLFQAQNDEGPCRDCCRTKKTVICEDITKDSRWPNFASRAIAENFTAVYALPLESQDVVVGALNLFSSTPLNPDQLLIARSLADAATMVFLQADTQHDRLLIARKIRSAVEGRNAIEQAKGVLSERYGISMMEAFWKLRDASVARDMDIVDLATSVVNHEIQL